MCLRLCPIFLFFVSALSQCADNDAQLQALSGNPAATCALASANDGACVRIGAMCPLSCQTCVPDATAGSGNCVDDDARLQTASGNRTATCAAASANPGACDQIQAVCPQSCDTCSLPSNTASVAAPSASTNAPAFYDQLGYALMAGQPTMPELISAIAPLSTAVSDTPTMVSCVYGYVGCIGVEDAIATNLTALAGIGCTVENGATNAASFTQIQRLCGNRQRSVMASTAQPRMDGLVCQLNVPVNLSSLSDTSQIAVRLADGTVRNPDCATLSPAAERNELHTMLLLSSEGFGAADNNYPTEVTMTRLTRMVPQGLQQQLAAQGVLAPFDVSYSGGNLNYAESRSKIARARLFSQNFAEMVDGTGIAMLDGAGNSCNKTVLGSTHSLQVIFVGGTTKDGIADLEKDDVNFFEVKLGGATLTTEVIGLADLHDGDNYIDICLLLSQQQISDLAAGMTVMTVDVLCDKSAGTDLYLPKGKCTTSSYCSEMTCERGAVTASIVINEVLFPPSLFATAVGSGSTPPRSSSSSSSSSNMHVALSGLAAYMCALAL